MILKLSLTVLLLYYLAVLWKYYRQDIAGIFGTAETDEDTDGTGKEPGQPGKPYTVMGESTYLPFAAEDGEEAAALLYPEKVRRVLVSDDAGEKAEREAREVLPSVMGSDIWEAMLDEFEGARERVARLMDNHYV